MRFRVGLSSSETKATCSGVPQLAAVFVHFYVNLRPQT